MDSSGEPIVPRLSGVILERVSERIERGDTALEEGNAAAACREYLAVLDDLQEISGDETLRADAEFLRAETR